MLLNKWIYCLNNFLKRKKQQWIYLYEQIPSLYEYFKFSALSLLADFIKCH